MLQFLIVVVLGSWCSSEPALAESARAQVSQQWGTWQHWGDQRDGTYRNPALPADFSDIDTYAALVVRDFGGRRALDLSRRSSWDREFQ